MSTLKRNRCSLICPSILPCSKISRYYGRNRIRTIRRGTFRSTDKRIYCDDDNHFASTVACFSDFFVFTTQFFSDIKRLITRTRMYLARLKRSCPELSCFSTRKPFFGWWTSLWCLSCKNRVRCLVFRHIMIEKWRSNVPKMCVVVQKCPENLFESVCSEKWSRTLVLKEIRMSTIQDKRLPYSMEFSCFGKILCVPNEHKMFVNQTMRPSKRTLESELRWNVTKNLWSSFVKWWTAGLFKL